MKWHFESDAPIYTQLIRLIKVAIATNEFQPGEKLPSVRDLATEAGVNPNTMQRAMTELEREGLVYSQRTSGRMVTEKRELIENVKISLAQGHVKDFMQAMERLGFEKNEMIQLIMQGKDE